MVSESMATQTAAIAMADFMKRMVYSSPDWTGDARAFQAAAFAATHSARAFCRYAEHYPLPAGKHGHAAENQLINCRRSGKEGNHLSGRGNRHRDNRH
jgi:hypothetical protein